MPLAAGAVNTAGWAGTLPTLKAMEYVWENRAGQRARSSSTEVAEAEKVYGSNASVPSVCTAPSVATTGLLPQSSEVKLANEGADRLPSLSTTTTDAVQVPADRLTENVGLAAVAKLRAVLPPLTDCSVQA